MRPGALRNSKTWRAVQSGRDKLRGEPVIVMPDTKAAAEGDGEEGHTRYLFDQERK